MFFSPESIVLKGFFIQIAFHRWQKIDKLARQPQLNLQQYEILESMS